MTEALKCPTCSAPLDYPDQGGPAVHCPYCNSTVMLSDATTSDATAPNLSTGLGEGVGSAIAKAIELAQIAKLARAGRKIEAIKMYRLEFGGDLATAKAAVESIAAGQPISMSSSMSSSSPAAMTFDSGEAVKLANSGLRFGCILVLVIVAFSGLMAALIVHSVHRQVAAVRTSIPTIVIPKFVTPPPPPPPPAFAHSVLAFGMEGIGAGQFKDGRSLAIDGNGHIYVGDYSDGRVQVFDATGKFVTMWSLTEKTSLLNLTADRHGTVYAISPGHIARYEGTTGRALGEIDGNNGGDTPEYFQDAYAALNGNLYAVGSMSDIVILAADGSIKQIIPVRKNIGEDVSFRRIAVSGAGDIYALDTGLGIFKFAPDGRYINRFGGGQGTGARPNPGRVTSSHNLAIDGKGRVYASGNGPAVQVFDGDGGFIDSFGGNDVAFGIVINDQDNLFACFRNQSVVRKFVLEKR